MSLAGRTEREGWDSDPRRPGEARAFAKLAEEHERDPIVALPVANARLHVDLRLISTAEERLDPASGRRVSLLPSRRRWPNPVATRSATRPDRVPIR